MSENVDTLMRDLEQELGVRGPAAVLRAALKIAKEAAAEAKAAEPPAPPAWRVEVAREGAAISAESHSKWEMARRFRSGEADHWEQFLAGLASIQVALSLGHVVVPRPMPSEEEILKGAREDAAQFYDRLGNYRAAQQLRSGELDKLADTQCALRARRNTLSEIRAVAPAAVPEGDLRSALNSAWTEGWVAAEHALMGVRTADFEKTFAEVRDADVAEILSTLPTRGA